jgi:uncharacterized membrane protein (UPF0127 family)
MAGRFSGDGIRQAIDARNGRAVATELATANRAWTRFRGLMLRASLPTGHALLIEPARGIHSHFMRFPIDLVFLDEGGRVTRLREAMRPWRFDLTNAVAVIEAPAGTIRAADVRLGDEIRFECRSRPSRSRGAKDPALSQ